MKRLVCAALTGAMAISLMACGNSASTSTSTSTAAENTSETAGSEAEGAEETGVDYGTLTMAVQINGHSIPMYMAEYEGLFAENGITAEMLYFTDGSTENEALGSDQWEIGGIGNMAAVAGGMAYNSHIIAAICDESYACDAWVREDSDIAQISGALDGYENVLGDADTWKGKTILVPTCTGAHYALGKCLELFGLTLDDVEVISMDVAKCFTAFSAGQGDVMCIWSPVSDQAEEAGFVKAYSSGDLGLIIPSYIVASEKAMENPEKVAAALKAVFEAIDKYDNDAAAEAPIMQQMANEAGSDYDLETCEKNLTQKPFYTLEQNIEFFSGEYGEREIDEFLGDVINFMVEQGVYEQSQIDTLTENNFIDSTIINMLAEDAQ